MSEPLSHPIVTSPSPPGRIWHLSFSFSRFSSQGITFIWPDSRDADLLRLSLVLAKRPLGVCFMVAVVVGLLWAPFRIPQNTYRAVTTIAALRARRACGSAKTASGNLMIFCGYFGYSWYCG